MKLRIFSNYAFRAGCLVHSGAVEAIDGDEAGTCLRGRQQRGGFHVVTALDRAAAEEHREIPAHHGTLIRYRPGYGQSAFCS